MTHQTQKSLTLAAIDAGLERFTPRHTVTGTELHDFLLDLRLIVEKGAGS